MANPIKGEIELLARDKTYILRFSIDAICSLEERLGKGFPAIAAEMADPSRITISLARHLLFAALSEKQPDITLKEAGELIAGAGGMVEVVTKVSEAISAAFPDAEARGTKSPRKRAGNRTGSPS